MSSAALRGRRVKPDYTWAAIGVAVALHVAVITSVHTFSIGELDGFGQSRIALADQQPDVELKSGCVGDAMFASTARAAMCFAPWQSDVDACLYDAQMSMWLDQSGCYASKEKDVSAISMISQKSIDKMKPIDPEPLLEAMQQEPPKPKPVEVPKLQPESQPKPPPPPPAAAKPRPMQVVETAKPSEEKPPENARFLAEYDTNVKKQTVARGTPKEPMVAKSKPSELKAKQNPDEASVSEHTDRPPGENKKAPDVPGTLAMRTPGPQAPAREEQEAKVRGSTSGASGSLAMDGYAPRKGQGAIEQQQQNHSELPRGENGAGGGAPDVPNLKPSQDVLERALGGGNVDHLDDVDNGDETALTAKRFVYASFFNRMKRQVAQNWDPATVWRRSDPTGQVFGFKTRITEVRVSLSLTGALTKIIVTAPCGVADLDEEAVRAFHSAAPFPNPPKELAGSDGLITFAFSFYFEIGQSHTSWHLPGNPGS